ncbi:DoxX family membrane protein [Niastella caeni]|uniref:DoxX family membrane protein n=1 Tax=Niastella caeni TaxID=2569763 RepID=A0A4S8HWJ1_9BACT|nr:MauE/DoxX family redox-associated membrane protein [Niastella caeni]THU39601.1 DoxX family membrane protein [Niastella caeni]
MEGPAIQKRNAFMRLITFTALSKSTIVEIISVLFIILFLYTGISKLMEYAVFKEQIAESPILKPVASFIAWALPLTEFIVSLLLIIPRWRLKGLYASLFLMIAFTIYIGAIMLFNKELPCSCGGIISELSWNGHLIFNSIFILLALIGVLLEKKIRRSIKADMDKLNGGNQ